MAKAKKKTAPREPTVIFRSAYSGDRSREFWRVVNSTNDPILYIFGCALQEMEERTLQALTAAQDRKP
jgi:hypothetical protein